MLNRIVDIRSGEWRRLLPLTAAYALILSSVYVLKPARNALFLDQLGITQLPYVLILVALIGGAIAAVYTRLTGNLRINRLIPGTFAVLIIHLAGFHWLFGFAGAWIYYLFYVWVNLYGVLTVSLLWLLANAVFNAREARRLFGFIGTGGIAGAVLGGTFTAWAADGVGTENLLLVCAGLIAASMVLVSLIRVGADVLLAEQSREGGALQAVVSSVLLRRMAGMVGVVAVVAVIADVQFNEIVDTAFETKDEKTAFFGTFFAYLNGFAFLFQLLVTPWVLKRFGVGGALLFLPVSMALGAFGVLLIAGLYGGIAVKVGDIGFRHSIHKSAVEVLFLPIPSYLKKRSKVFLDTTVDNLATGLGAVLVLILAEGIGLSYRQLSFLSLVLIAVWVWNLLQVRDAYVDAFRLALDRREILADDFRVQLDSAVVKTLLQGLRSSNPRQIAYALSLLATTDGQDLTSEITPLIKHSDAEVRRLALQAMRPSAYVDLQPLVRGLLQDENISVRVEALHFLQRQALKSDLNELRDYLQNSDEKIRTAALGYISQYGTVEEKHLIDKPFVQSVLSLGKAGERRLLVRALGGINNPELQPFIFELMHDADPEVVREVIRSFKITTPEFIAWLLDRLAEPPYRVDVRKALAGMGEGVLAVLNEALNVPQTAMRIRLQVPRVIADVPSQFSVDLLLHKVEESASGERFIFVKALSKLRASEPQMDYDAERGDRILVSEAKSYYEMMRLLQIFESTKSKAFALLKRALHEHRDRALEQIFRLLGLQYPPKDMYHAYLGMVSHEKSTRANALEFLDNVLENTHKNILLTLIDVDSIETALAHGRDFFWDTLHTREDGLLFLVEGDDVWLKACALNCVETHDSDALIALLQVSRLDAHPLISETAEFAALNLAFEV